MGFLKLLTLCGVMFLSSFASGMLPLSFKLSPQYLRLITTVGVGLLVGVAFIVIIPEGVHTYYGVAQHSHKHTHENGMQHEHRHDLAVSHEHSLDSDSTPETPVPLTNSLGDRSDSLSHSDGHRLRLLSATEEFLSDGRRTKAGHGTFDAADQGESFALLSDADPGEPRSLTERKSLSQPETIHSHSQANELHHDDHSEEVSESKQFLADAEREFEGGYEHEQHDRAESDAVGESGADCLASDRDSQLVGLSLVLGFVLMLLVDRISGGHSHGHNHGMTLPARAHPHSHSHTATSNPSQTINIIPPSANSASSTGNSPIIGATAASSSSRSSSPLLVAKSSGNSINPIQNSSSSSTSSRIPQSLLFYSPPSAASTSTSSPARVYNNTALLGILIHSAIDGLALGAISVNENSALEWVVFLAIILHKSPAALGLSSFLLYQERSKAEVRQWILIFSLAAPLTALFTYVVFLQSSLLAESDRFGSAGRPPPGVSTSLLGLCLLFSAGTFLFTIAVHILPEISRKEGEQIQWRYIACLVLGILAPLALGGHHHH